MPAGFKLMVYHEREFYCRQLRLGVIQKRDVRGSFVWRVSQTKVKEGGGMLNDDGGFCCNFLKEFCFYFMYTRGHIFFKMVIYSAETNRKLFF